MRKLLFVFAIVLLLSPSVLAENDWFFKGQGGVFSTNSALKDGEVWGTAQFEFVRIVFGDHIAIGGTYQDINGAEEQWEDYAGAIYLYTRNPRLKKFQPYLFTGGGLAHASKEGAEVFGEGSFNGGFGLLIPIFDMGAVVEFGGKNIDGDWLMRLTAGLQIGLDF